MARQQLAYGRAARIERPAVRVLDKVVAVIAVIYPLTGVPQILKIWLYKDAEGVSLATWSLFLLFIIPLIIYAILKGEKKLALMWSLWVFVYVIIIGGVLLYS